MKDRRRVERVYLTRSAPTALPPAGSPRRSPSIHRVLGHSGLEMRAIVAVHEGFAEQDLLRKMAALSISNPEGIPARRYTP